MTLEREKYIRACSSDEAYIRSEVAACAKEIKDLKKELSYNTKRRNSIWANNTVLKEHWKANALLLKIAKAKYMAVKRLLPKRNPTPKPEPTYYAWSVDGEYYSPKFETKKEAMEDAVKELWRDAVPNKEIYIGKCYNDFKPRINVDWLLEDLEQQAYDHSREFAEGYLCSVPLKQRNELAVGINKAFTAWAKKYRHIPEWFLVNEYEVYKFKDCVAAASEEIKELCRRKNPES